MRTHRLYLGAFIAFALSAATAQTSNNLYLHFTNGDVLGIARESIKGFTHDNQQCTLTLLNDSVLTWPSTDIDSVGNSTPVYPQFTELKLDDKLNDQIFRDIDATVTPNQVTMTIGAIGKYLTPSFKMDMPDAIAYIDGKEQVSGQSRMRFADEVKYLLTLPGHKQLTMTKVSDEVWSETVQGTHEIALAEDMLSTNEPAARSEGFENLFDGDHSTIFHSRWESNGANINQPAYIAVTLPHAISELQFWYVGRMNSKYDIFEWLIEASNDGYNWKEVTTLDSQHGLPASNNADYEFTSPNIALGGAYSYLRFTATQVGHKNYLCLGEFRLYEVGGESSESVLLQPAQYAYRTVPMGREVPVIVDWLTDHATSVPRIDINIDEGKMVSSKDYYLNAHITIQSNGVWEDMEDSVQIKGRGNSSWSSNPFSKNPYRLKFASSVKPFGMKKGKNWNLIAQKQSGSLLTNAVAMKVARLTGTAAANDVIPVELYMNGEYRGSYIFTQKVGMANNSVDYDDESQAVLFELDEYSEAGQFRSDSYYLPVNIKDPEFGEDETLLDYDGVRAEFNRFETAVYDGTNFERFIDIDMLTRYMLLNELVLNTELGHPKSTFLSRENLNHLSSRYTFGPGWDFDWSYGYEGSYQYCVKGATKDFFSYHTGKPGNLFFSALWRSSEWVQYHYYQLWKEFIDKHLQELIDFVDDYYAFARSSFENNSYLWGDGDSYQYEEEVANMKSWLTQRAHHIMSTLYAYAPDDAVPYSYGDINGDELIDDDDRVVMLDMLLGGSEKGLDKQQADADVDGQVTIADFVWVNQLVGDMETSQARSRLRIDEWAPDAEEADVDDIDIDDMTTLLAQPADAAKAQTTRSEENIVWLQTLTRDDGLLSYPYFNFEAGIVQYEYTSPLITSSSPIERLRLLVTETSSFDTDKSGYPCFAIAEFYLYDAYGNPIELTAANFSTNAQERTEGPMRNIVDGNVTTFFHSTWTSAVYDFHYIDITLPEPMTELSFGYLSRNEKIAPSTIDIYSVTSDDIPEEDEKPAPTPSDQLTLAATEDNGVYTLAVSLSNEQPYVAFMMDLVLPAALTIDETATALTPRTESTHHITGRLIADNTYRLIGYSASNATIADTKGTLFTLSLKTDDTQGGTFAIKATDIKFITGNAIEQHLGNAEGTLTIEDKEDNKKQTQTIPFEAFPAHTYGDNSIALPSVTDAGLAITYTSSNTSVATIKGNIVTIISAGTTDITATQGGNDNVHEATPVTHTLTISKAPLTITAHDASHEAGTTQLPELTMSFTGFLRGDTEADLDELPSITCEVTTSTPAGTYPIRLSGGNDNNYTYVLKDGTYTITKRKQSIPFEAFPAHTYGDTPIALPSVTDAGLAITYASYNTSVATIKGNIVTIVGAGKAQIIAVQSGNDHVTEASPVTRILNVDKALLTITADDITRERYIDTLPPYTLSFDGFVHGDTEADLDELPRIECTANESSPVGTYTIHLTGGNDNNYTYVLNDGTLTIADTSAISEMDFATGVDIYDIHGRLVRKGATSLEGLKRGVYIINHRKVIVS